MKRQQCVVTYSPQESARLGWQLAQVLPPGALLALHGDLGAGKTALTQGLAVGLGITAPVTSPTFTLVNRYAAPSGVELVHIDVYRLGEEVEGALREATTFGLEEILAETQSILVIEWAERVATLLPADHLQLWLSYHTGQEQTREIKVVATGPVSRDWLDAWWAIHEVEGQQGLSQIQGA
jgi:tRNA threonylcarbamoyladenosine biosynthesis protein TsaE